jgi:hypothetical protein
VDESLLVEEPGEAGGLPRHDPRTRRPWHLVLVVIALGIFVGVTVLWIGSRGSNREVSGGNDSSSTPALPQAPTPSPSAGADVAAPAPSTTTTTDGAVASSPTNSNTPGSSPLSTAGTGDLGIDGHMITNLETCDGQFLTLAGAAVTPASYAVDVSRLLDQYPGSQYLQAAASCASLRPRTTDGSLIYAVYFGPFLTAEGACAARGQGPPDAYVKRLTPRPDEPAVPCT